MRVDPITMSYDRETAMREREHCNQTLCPADAGALLAELDATRALLSASEPSPWLKPLLNECDRVYGKHIDVTVERMSYGTRVRIGNGDSRPMLEVHYASASGAIGAAYEALRHLPSFSEK